MKNVCSAKLYFSYVVESGTKIVCIPTDWDIQYTEGIEPTAIFFVKVREPADRPPDVQQLYLGATNIFIFKAHVN